MTTPDAPAAIRSFVGEYRFLSNFWPATIQLDGYHYLTVEHAYQASKTLDERERNRIRSCPNAGMAKRFGKAVQLRAGWDDLRLGIMEDLVRQKFKRNPILTRLLVGTAPAELIEGNTHGETFWGVYAGQGENHLGKILMKIRSELS